MPGDPRSRLVLACEGYDSVEGYFFVSSVRPHIGWLEEFFDVTCVVNNEELAGAVATAPDVVVLLSASYGIIYKDDLAKFREITVGIPVIFLTLSDAHTAYKTQLLYEYQAAGAEAIFVVDTGSSDLFGDFACETYVVPWFLSGEVMRDYGLEKEFPVVLAGHGYNAPVAGNRYPWRAEVGPILRDHFPVLSTPRPQGSQAHRYVGEEFAKLLNRAQIVPNCGTARQIFTKKFIEIPACRSCLLAEPSEVLNQLGYRDMENCVLAEPDEVVEKCRMLLADPGRLETITNAGYALVWGEHVASRRTQLHDWVRLRKEGAKEIFQPSLMGALTVKQENANPAPSSKSPFHQLLSGGWKAFLETDLTGAGSFFEKALEYRYDTPEPACGMALVHLAQGAPDKALALLTETLEIGIALATRQPDPVVWALYLAAELGVEGDSEELELLAGAFPWLGHPWLCVARDMCGTPQGSESGSRSFVPVPDCSREQIRTYLSLPGMEPEPSPARGWLGRFRK